jgi:hypothetical protein
MDHDWVVKERSRGGLPRVKNWAEICQLYTIV